MEKVALLCWLAIVRWMTSFDTTEKDVKEFVEFVRETVNK